MTQSNALTALGADEKDAVLVLERKLREDATIAALIDAETGQSLHQDLARFLRAKKGNIDAALIKATNYYRWIHDERPENINDSDIGAELESGKLLYMCNDNEGHPVFLIRAALHFPPYHHKGFAKESTRKLLIAVVRYAILRMSPNVESFVLVSDMQQFGFVNKDVGVLKSLGGLIAKYFPGRLHKIYVVNSSFIMWGFWKLIRPLVEKKWLDIIDFLSSPKELLNWIKEKNLPMQYGGKIVPEWEQWTQGSRKAIVESVDMQLRTYCRYAIGLNIPDDDELIKLQDLAHSTSPTSIPSDEKKSCFECK